MTSIDLNLHKILALEIQRHEDCVFRTIVATRFGMIVATNSGVIVATHFGALLPPLNQ
jgi:ligand-binding sensor domain-containing protein